MEFSVIEKLVYKHFRKSLDESTDSALETFTSKRNKFYSMLNGKIPVSVEDIKNIEETRLKYISSYYFIIDNILTDINVLKIESDSNTSPSKDDIIKMFFIKRIEKNYFILDEMIDLISFDVENLARNSFTDEVFKTKMIKNIMEDINNLNYDNLEEISEIIYNFFYEKFRMVIGKTNIIEEEEEEEDINDEPVTENSVII